MIAGPQYLTETQTSELTSIPLSTLRNNRFERKGIPYIKLNRSVRYKITDVVDYMDKHRVDLGKQTIERTQR